jgi:hypothetical protein
VVAASAIAAVILTAAISGVSVGVLGEPSNPDPTVALQKDPLTRAPTSTPQIIMPAQQLEKRAAGGQQGGAKGSKLRDRTEKAARDNLVPTTFRVSSFNVLGAAHTAARGNKPRFASGTTRMGWAMGLLNGANVSVAGLQEFEPPQLAAFKRIAPAWGVWPGLAVGHQALANSVVWRRDTWAFVEGHTIGIPYFYGKIKPMPYLLLRHLGTGQQVWFANFHNPADVRGPAGKHRAVAVAREAALANTLSASGLPVIITGDFNAKADFFCAMTTRSSMHSSTGGSSGSPCQPPGNMGIDWIMGSSPVSFSNHNRVRNGLVSRTSDHPFVWADASLG